MLPIKQAKDFADQSRSGAVNPRGKAGLAQILAGKARSQQFNVSGQAFQLANVSLA
jgi:hypothetical protein